MTSRPPAATIVALRASQWPWRAFYAKTGTALGPLLENSWRYGINNLRLTL
jgi:hypothetical protein